MAWYPSASRQFPDGAQRRLDLGEPVLAIEQPPRADGRSSWHDRPAGSAEVDAGRLATATIAASRLKLLFRVLRYLGGVLSRHQGPCVQRLRSPSPLARCSG